MRHTVDFLHQQRPLGAVAKIELHHILLLAADIGCLRREVDDMAAVAGQFLDDVSAFPQTGQSKATIGRGLISTDDRAARAGGSGQILYLKNRVAHCFAGDTIVLPHHQRGEGDIFKGQRLRSAGLDVDLLRGLLDRVPRGRFQLRNLVPAITQAADLELTVFIGIENAEVIDLTAVCAVAGISHLEFCTLQRISCHTVHLFHRQAGLLVIFKVNRVVAVRIKSYKLRGGVQ